MRSDFFVFGKDFDDDAFARMAILDLCREYGHFTVTPTHVLVAVLYMHQSKRHGNTHPFLDEYLLLDSQRMRRILALFPVVVDSKEISLFGTTAQLTAEAETIWNHLASTNFDLTVLAGFMRELTVVDGTCFSQGNPAADKQPSDGAGTVGTVSEADATNNAHAINNGDAMRQLHALVGLEETKAIVQRILATEAANNHRKLRNLKPVGGSMHYIYSGSPGTGKTTVARLMGSILADIGSLSRGHLVEVSRADLIGRYLGETSVQTRVALESAKGGVLFIDEAYSLVGDEENDMYGREAIVEILRFMESNREDFCIILAGYEEQMQSLLESNPGLGSRFSTTVHFPDYSVGELSEIFMLMANDHDIVVSKAVAKRVASYLELSDAGGTGGNARFVRNLFEEMYRNMAARAIADGKITHAEVTKFAEADVPAPKVAAHRADIGFRPN